MPTPFNTKLNELTVNDQLWESFWNKFQDLSLNLRNLMTGTDEFPTSLIIEEKIGRLNGLTLDQLEDLAMLIRNMILGDLFVGDTPSAISEKLGVDSVKAQNIMKSVLVELFKPPYLDDLKKIQREHFPERSVNEQRPSGSAPATNRPPSPLSEHLSNTKLTPRQISPKESILKVTPPDIPSAKSQITETAGPGPAPQKKIFQPPRPPQYQAQDNSSPNNDSKKLPPPNLPVIPNDSKQNNNLIDLRNKFKS